uniref:Uncharacterized protein n=1 Tax=Ceratitis capitata TaxID=7213 RepID=W8BAS3_CERCA
MYIHLLAKISNLIPCSCFSNSDIKLVFAKAAPGGKTPPDPGILSLSFNMVTAVLSNATHVAPYPGLGPDTFTVKVFDGGSVYWSVGSDNRSDLGHPIALIIKENLTRSIKASEGPSWEANPKENTFGYLSNNLRPNENFVNIPKETPTSATKIAAIQDLKAT